MVSEGMGHGCYMDFAQNKSFALPDELLSVSEPLACTRGTKTLPDPGNTLGLTCPKCASHSPYPVGQLLLTLRCREGFPDC